MTTMNNRTRISLSPEATKVAFAPDASGELARVWLRYIKGMVIEDGFDLEDVVAPDVRCVELELAGYPAGATGLRLFRDEVCAAAPDISVHVLYITAYAHRSTIDAIVRCTATVPGAPAGAEPVSWDVRTLSRFDGGVMVERWDRAELPSFLTELRNAA